MKVDSPHRLITVRFISGAHQTCTIRGQRASSTAGYLQAAAALAAKLHPGAAIELRRVAHQCGSALEVYEMHLPNGEEA